MAIRKQNRKKHFLVFVAQVNSLHLSLALYKPKPGITKPLFMAHNYQTSIIGITFGPKW